MFAYGGKKLEGIGQFDAELSIDNKKIESDFVVTDNGRCFLGNARSKVLGVIRNGITSSLETDCKKVHDIAAEHKVKYPNVFSGIGKLGA